jgi:site-specific DNA-methyltransferase (adenine-specific)
MTLHVAKKIVQQRTDALLPYARNSRTHSEEQVYQIAQSIREFGFTNPVLVDAANNIVAGHGRVMAAKQLGLVDVPTINVGWMTEQQRRAYVIADNQLALNAGWDDSVLAQEVAWLQDQNFNTSLLGFDTDFLDGLLAEEAATGDGLTDQDDAPAVQATPITRLGDVWVMGKHRLLCGDSTSLSAVNTLTLGGGIDMLLTDPPYNVAYEGKTADALTIQNDSMSDASFRKFLRDAFAAADSVMKAGAVFYIWHAGLESFNFQSACGDVGWKVRQYLIWNKNVMVMGRQDYHWRHEPCLYGWKEGAGHLWASDRKQTTVLNFDRPSRNLEHPTMKPVALFEYQLLNNTKGGDLCLDLFGGSGTTLIACEKNGRYARIMELDPKYCDVIVRRWQAFTGKQAVLESTGTPFPEAPPVLEEVAVA